MPDAPDTAAHYVGIMSGTSLDGVDAALVSFQTEFPRLIASHFRPLPADLRQNLAELSLSADVSLQKLGETDARLGELLAECALQAIAAAGMNPDQVRAIGSHGVTVRHAPECDAPFTLQLGDANRIAHITGLTTVADFRRRDIAAGGHGAPLVPAFHRAVFASPDENRVVLNIGGIANITILPKNPSQPVTGFDTGPGNTLLDHWAQRHLGQPIDRDGAWGASGQCHQPLLKLLMDETYFERSPPKSTGKELFSPAWLRAKLEMLAKPPAAADVQATLAHLTARTVAQAVQRYAPDTESVLVCGGGVHNRHLMALLAELLDCPVESTGKFALDPDWIEAMAFAWLARQTLLGLPGNLPEVTGAKHRVVLGAVYPGRLG
ncbi:anhydro-N-acetylmuramic acid kinase [Methylogaea oryzae]|uniref:Anhydro-N-acetylmuramic acid kinase n=1 Tax=Methylogaea oryzae TaxID=1295382 RepID=A0A8D4VKS8_9GAMM|nr:anhydro-N-acetylmuramic acid kinase [Methylogaea oryzae]BBL69663.1 anhydro-N-acetylmuramic acid kinase [Methylogaea oryzae]